MTGPREAPRGLDAFFAPRGVAVIGASRTPGKVGHAVLRNLLYGDGRGAERAQGFPGRVQPVSHHAGEILGVPAVELSALEGPFDLAVFAVPAPAVPAALDLAARRGVRAAIILSVGFFEMGSDGHRLGAQVASVAQNTGIRVIGPNCTGIYSARSRLSASFFSVPPHLGPITLISQSGAIAQALVQISQSDALGLRNVVSLGDRIDLDFPELLRYLAREEETRVLAVYAESLADARAFHTAIREVAPRKPVVVLRAGHTGAGHRAARLYEALDTLDEPAVDSALASPGLYRTQTLPAFLAASRALASQPPAQGRRVAIVTNAGGVGVLAADAVATAGLDVVKLRPETVARLREVVANPRSCTNPVDLLGDARPDRFLAALEVVSSAPEVDALLLVLTDQAMTDPLEVATRVSEWARSLSKPLVATFVGLVTVEGQHHEVRFGLPVYTFPEDAVEGLRALVARGAYLRRLKRRPEPSPERQSRSAPRSSWR